MDRQTQRPHFWAPKVVTQLTFPCTGPDFSSCSWGCWGLVDGGQHRYCAPCLPCCCPGLYQMVVSRTSHFPNLTLLPSQSLFQSFPVGSSISLISWQELWVAKLTVHFTEGNPGWDQGLYGREMGSAFPIKSNCVVINVTFAPLFLIFPSSFSGFSFHLSHHS